MASSKHLPVVLAVVVAGCGGQVLLGTRAGDDGKSASSSGGSSSSSSSGGTTGAQATPGVSAACNPTLGVVAQVPDSTMEIAVDAQNVYFRAGYDGTELLSIGKGGGGPTQLVQAPHLFEHFEVDAENVYYSLGNVLSAVPKAGGPPRTIFQGESIGAHVVDGTSIYFVRGGDILRTPTAGGDPVTMASGETPDVLLVDRDNLYWVNTPPGTNGPGTITVRRVAKAGGAPATIATLGSLDGADNYYPEGGLRFAQDDANLYWADRQGHAIMKFPKDGGAQVTLAQGATTGFVVSLVVNGGYVYFIEGISPYDSDYGATRAFRRVPVAGGSVEDIMTLPEAGGAQGGDAYALAHDGDTFYFTTYWASPGTVKRITCTR